MPPSWTVWESSMNNRYTAALVGCGRIGYSLGLDKKREQPASHTMALLDNPRIQLVAGCDTDLQMLRIWHEANKKAAVYQSSSELYNWQRPDIVTVAVNEKSHKEEAIAAIKAHPKLVILEKPVALNTAEAEVIQAVADEHKVPVLINHERRFGEDYRAAKVYLPKIGEVQSIRGGLFSSMCVYNPAEENSGAYSLIHDGTHLVDAIEFFLDDERLSNPVITGLLHDKKACVRQFSAHYMTSLCPDVTIFMSGRSRYFGFEIEITGTEGRICIGNSYLKLYKRGESPLYTGFYSLLNDRASHLPKKVLYFPNMIQNAVDFLDGKAELQSTIKTGMQDLAVLEEMKEKIGLV